MTMLIRSHGIRSRTCTWFAAVAIMSIALDASAQAPVGTQWQQGGLLSGFVGAGSTSSETIAAAGTALGWEVFPHLTIEGRGTWLHRDQVPADFTATLAALIPLLPQRSIVPFALGGVGMYRATVEPGSPDVPAFYRDRMPPGSAREIFQDVTLVFGGGAEVFVTPHFAIRPEVTFPVILSGSSELTKAVWGVYVAYHFEARARP
jgi:hypothetical protein